MGAVFCTLELVLDDFADYRDSKRTAVEVDTVHRSRPSAASARRHRPRLSDIRVVEEGASLLSI